MKEYLVYCVELIYCRSVNAPIIYSWSEQEELCDEAKEFIQTAEKKGNVYSLLKFSTVLNFEDINMSYYYCFITNKY